jgi:YidC/Oxa1 family membrane protein insertase
MGIINAIADVLATVLSVFTDWSGSAIVAIALLTLAVKVVLHPLTRKQLKSMKAMHALTPHIAALREKYKDNPQQMNVEMMNLYRAHNVNPFGGCLPLLLQLPILWALFAVFRRPGVFNGETFLGIPLETVPVSNGNFFSSDFWVGLWDVVIAQPVVAVLIVLVGLTTFLQQRMSVTDPAQARMFLFMPIMFAVFAVAFPVGMSIYWIIYSVLGTLEYMLVAGRPSPPGAAVVRTTEKPEVFAQRPKNSKKK